MRRDSETVNSMCNFFKETKEIKTMGLPPAENNQESVVPEFMFTDNGYDSWKYQAFDILKEDDLVYDLLPLFDDAFLNSSESVGYKRKRVDASPMVHPTTVVQPLKFEKAENDKHVAEPPAKKPKKSIGKAKRGKHWHEMEEIILIGVIFDQLFVSGCLSSQAWARIQQNYDDCWTEYCRKTGRNLAGSKRSQCALLRHFKVMKSRLSKQMDKGLFKVYYQTWNKHFGSLM